MYLCEQCGKEVYEKFGSGRFCSRSCSNKYVALHQSPEAKSRKIEKGRRNLELGKGSNVGFLREACVKGGKATAEYRKTQRREWLESILESDSNVLIGSYSKFRDRLVEFGYKEWKCDCCGNTEWMGKKIPLEVHHKKGKSNKLDNIDFLCPNCHAQTPNYRWRVYLNRKYNKEE